MSREPLRGLMTNYVLDCIGFLPVEMAAYMGRRIQKTHGGDEDWKATLRGVLRLDEGLNERLQQMWRDHQQQAALSGTAIDPLTFARQAIEDKSFAHLFRPKLTVVPAIPWSGPTTVKAVGFWRYTDGSFPQYPQPQALVKPGWQATELKRIIAYLRSGYNAHPDFMFCGWSSCRFADCVEGFFNGSRELTDGEWGWPEGLAHYVERHAVILPEEFIATMRANGWETPPQPDPPHRTEFDFTFWVNWAAR
jgi:hypothetical protein